ncbi:hypothetical protein [Novosphingobium album (ex Liu et al. 2023)]|uniref:Uncharacterized protein n=1 Tax=Novosphingobium album (ex Liu et al. 2023) TaxID=3031130 RepID=A0ABT5WLB3_9SPHN|nr:hypothetical protein [Novosphingobium album (ex Liu et al. 2023)]MDE8650830.1 hypothetical protein [Novosphingobium album (ex Liu et al. 2023)]
MRLKPACLATLAAIVMTGLLAGCGASGTHYDKTPQQVAAALRSAYLPTHILGSTVKGSRVSQASDGAIVTALLDENGRELMRFVTTVTPDGAGSRVATAVEPPHGANAERAGKAMAQNGYAMGLMKLLAKEHVAAAIEGRPFDMMFASPPMAKEMLGAMPDVQARINQANAGAMDEARADQDGESEEFTEDDWGGSRN